MVVVAVAEVDLHHLRAPWHTCLPVQQQQVPYGREQFMPLGLSNLACLIRRRVQRVSLHMANLCARRSRSTCAIPQHAGHGLLQGDGEVTYYPGLFNGGNASTDPQECTGSPTEVSRSTLGISWNGIGWQQQRRGAVCT